MNLITRQFLANRAAKRWAEKYEARVAPLFCGRSAREIYQELKALGPEPHPDEVDRVIGNDSWTRIQCDHCRASVERAINIDVTSGEYTTYICVNCVGRMIELVPPPF